MSMFSELKHGQKLKLCDKCQKTKTPEGGIQLGTKWNCQSCWMRRMTLPNLRSQK